MIPLSQRGEIRLGFRCNARCGFCYYQDLLDTPVAEEPGTDSIRRHLRRLRAIGATEVEFTGGEPTIKPDLAALITAAREMGFVNISIITNGLRLANPDYARKLIEAGLNDVLFSVHGADARTHDLHTQIPGSFEKVMQAIRNVQQFGVRTRISSTLTGCNVAQTEEMFALFLAAGAACLHFAVFSPVAQAQQSNSQLYVSYSNAAQALKQAIDRFAEQLPPLSVKYIPFCFMQGYEHYVMNLYQQSFDPDDWNYYYSNKTRRAQNRLVQLAFDAIALAGVAFLRDRKTARAYGFAGLKVFGFTRLVEMLRKKRLQQCRTCRYDNVCDHAWKNYVAHNGSDEFMPVSGTKISHPAWSYVMSQYRHPGVPLPAGVPTTAPKAARAGNIINTVQVG